MEEEEISVRGFTITCFFFERLSVHARLRPALIFTIVFKEEFLVIVEKQLISVTDLLSRPVCDWTV